METTDTRKIVEALLFIAQKPLTFPSLASFIERNTPADRREGLREKIRQALLELEEQYREGHGIVLVHVAGGYQLRTDHALAPWLQKFLAAKPERFSRSALETLSIIAYKQPLTRAEIEAIRGVDCTAVMGKLLEKGLVRITGKKEVPGRPLLYGTTKEFLELFGLNEIGDLPTLRQIDELVPKDEPEVDPAGTAAEEVSPPPQTLS
ncbi:MAG: SMC-Scp complex subunit ScpB [Nitrospirae bacterium]|nr:SMC-Scp complex subunit ScpB [Nitrospirota bacterium]